MPLVYHKTGENPSPSFFWNCPLFGGDPLVKCMLNLCGQAVRKKFHLPHLTQDKALFSTNPPDFGAAFFLESRRFLFFFRKTPQLVYIKEALGGNGGKLKTAWDKVFFTVSTEFSTSPGGNGGYLAPGCGKVECFWSQKKNFLAWFERKYSKKENPVQKPGNFGKLWGFCPHFYLRFSGMYAIMVPNYGRKRPLSSIIRKRAGGPFAERS